MHCRANIKVQFRVMHALACAEIFFASQKSEQMRPSESGKFEKKAEIKENKQSFENCFGFLAFREFISVLRLSTSDFALSVPRTLSFSAHTFAAVPFNLRARGEKSLKPETRNKVSD